MAARLVWLGVVLAVLNGLSVQAQELLAPPAAKPMPGGSSPGIEAVADLIRAAEHLEAANAIEVARAVRQQAKLLVKRESERLAEAQARLQQLAASIPAPQFRIEAVICEVFGTTKDDLHCAIQTVAGHESVSREQEGCVWTVGCNCSSELMQRLSGEDKKRVKILSHRHILAFDDQAAAIETAPTVPIVGGISLVNGQAEPVMTNVSVGLESSITPRLIDPATLRLGVSLEQTALKSEEVPVFTDSATGVTFLSPIKEVASAWTTAELKPGGTLVAAVPAISSEKLQGAESPPLLVLIATPTLVGRE